MNYKFIKAVTKFINFLWFFAPAILPVLPIIFIIYISFFPPGGEPFKAYEIVYGPSPIKGLNNLERQVEIFFNTAFLGFLTVIWASIFSIPAAFAVFKLPDKLSKFFRAMLVLPLLLPPYVIARGFMDLLLPERAFSDIYKLFTGADFDYNNIFVASLVLAIWLFPVMFIFLINALRRLDRRHFETARLFAGRFFIFKKITIPLLFNTYLSSSLLIFVLAINNFGIPALFNIRTVPTVVYAYFNMYFDWRRFPVTVAQGLPLFLLLIPAVIFFNYTEQKSRRFLISSERTGFSSDRTLAKILPLMIAPLIVIYLSVVLPVTSLAKRIESIWIFEKVFARSGDDILRSFLIAALAGLISIVVWGLWAIILANRKTKLSIFLLTLSILPLAFPRALMAISFLRFMDSGFYALIISYVFLFAPFAVRAAISNVQEINPSLAEGLETIGLDKPKIYRKLYVPLTIKPLISAGLLISVFVLGEVIIGQMLSAAGFGLVSITIYNLIHYSADEYVAALSLILMFITSGIYFVYLLLFEGEINRL